MIPCYFISSNSFCYFFDWESCSGIWSKPNHMHSTWKKIEIGLIWIFDKYKLWVSSALSCIEITPSWRPSELSKQKNSETSSSVSFCWLVPQWSCRFKLPSTWHASTHRNWFHLTVGSPWQCRSLTPRHPLIDLLGSSILFPSFSLISTRILSDQLLCPGTWAGLHCDCSNGFSHLDVTSTSPLKVAVIVIQSVVLAMEKHL